MTNLVQISKKDLKNEKIIELLKLMNVADENILKLNEVDAVIKDLKLEYKNKELDTPSYLNSLEVIKNDAKKFGIKIEFDQKDKLNVTLEIKRKDKLEEKKSLVNEENPKLYAVSWTESERGWGTRPDGITVHTSEVEAKRFLREYLDSQPKKVPEEYTRPDSLEPKLVEVSQSIMKAIMSHGKREHSLWLSVNSFSGLKNYDASSYNAKTKKNGSKP